MSSALSWEYDSEHEKSAESGIWPLRVNGGGRSYQILSALVEEDVNECSSDRATDFLMALKPYIFTAEIDAPTLGYRCFSSASFQRLIVDSFVRVNQFYMFISYKLEDYLEKDYLNIFLLPKKYAYVSTLLCTSLRFIAPPVIRDVTEAVIRACGDNPPFRMIIEMLCIVENAVRFILYSNSGESFFWKPLNYMLEIFSDHQFYRRITLATREEGITLGSIPNDALEECCHEDVSCKHGLAPFDWKTLTVFDFPISDARARSLMSGGLSLADSRTDLIILSNYFQVDLGSNALSSHHIYDPDEVYKCPRNGSHVSDHSGSDTDTEWEGND